MPESAAKRKLRSSQTTLSASGPGRAGAGGVSLPASIAHSAASALPQLSLSAGSALISPKTAPASTAESWSLSPRRMIRAPSGTASSSRVASARSSIDASSTTSASIGSGLPAWWTKPPAAGVTPSRRCTVLASAGRRLRNGSGRCAARSRIASVIRAAALPVGAASAIRDSGSCASRQASRFTTVVVLPVPGPPLITVSRPRSASAAASFCQSAAPASPAALAANSACSRSRVAASSSSGGALAARTSRAASRRS